MLVTVMSCTGSVIVFVQIIRSMITTPVFAPVFVVIVTFDDVYCAGRRMILTSVSEERDSEIMRWDGAIVLNIMNGPFGRRL